MLFRSDAELVLKLSREAERNGFGGLLFCDLPEVDATTAAGRMVLTVMASVAEFESRRIGERTREAMAAAKARGVRFGGVRPGTLKRNDAARDRATAGAGTSSTLGTLALGANQLNIVAGANVTSGRLTTAMTAEITAERLTARYGAASNSAVAAVEYSVAADMDFNDRTRRCRERPLCRSVEAKNVDY